MNKIALEKLKKAMRQTIADNVPINTTCPVCEEEMPPECLIEAESRFPSDMADWDTTTIKVIKLVVDAIPELMKED